MAHFLTLVLVDETDPDPIARATQLMKAFWGAEFFDEETGLELPNVKCDGFTVGGSYDGVIWGKEQHYNLTPEAYRRRYGLDVVLPEDNIRPVSELVPDIVEFPYALITPNGRWLEREDRPVKDWQDELRSLLEEHRHRLAVAMDCHC